MSLVIRRASIVDSVAIAEMANALNRHVGITTAPFTEAIVRRDGFGPAPAFSVLIAERDGATVGYALLHSGYNTDIAARSIVLSDIYVVEGARRLGVGRALMAATAAEALQTGAACVEWGVHAANVGAREFYRQLGAVSGEVHVLGLFGDALAALARLSPTISP
jgi:GNAT superfamily N-acetyltransferase